VSGIEGKLEDRRANLKRAAELADRLSERDALLFRAAMAQSEGRIDEALRDYETLMAKYPDEVDAYASAAFLQDSPDKNVAILQRGVQAVPTSGELYNMLGYSLISDGRPDEAVVPFETYVRLRPNEPNALDSLAEDYLVLGELDKALEQYGRAINAGHSPLGRAWTLAVLGRYDEAFNDFGTGSQYAVAVALARLGRYREAFEELDASVAAAEKNQNPLRVASLSLIRSGLELDRGECSNAMANAAATSLKLNNRAGGDLSAYTMINGPLIWDLILGTCEARAGKVQDARKLLESARPNYRDAYAYQRFAFHSLEGEIALAEKDPARAAAAFTAAEPQRKMPFNRSADAGYWTLLGNSVLPRDGLARARVAQGRIDDAIAIYRGLLTPGRDSKFTAFFEPRYILALARLLQRNGRKDAARAEYRRFLEYWKKADPNLPEIAEARRGAS
jgi:tetratricopeptide (TPR) repeat protein